MRIVYDADGRRHILAERRIAVCLSRTPQERIYRISRAVFVTTTQKDRCVDHPASPLEEDSLTLTLRFVLYVVLSIVALVSQKRVKGVA
jgi:hypothetical protein